MCREKPIVYGGASRYLENCPRCQQSVQKHPIHGIKPGDMTGKGVEALRQLLNSVVNRGMELQRDPIRGDLMLGALQAVTTRGQTIRLVAHSGPDNLLSSGQRSCAGWEVITAMPPSLAEGRHFDVRGAIFEAVLPQGEGRRTECAAQKLLNALFSRLDGCGIQSIEMTEMFWVNPVVPKENRNWSQIKPVPSCDVCARVLPQMLCALADAPRNPFLPVELPPPGTSPRDLRCSNAHEFRAHVADNAWTEAWRLPAGVTTPCPNCRRAVPCWAADYRPAQTVRRLVACPYCASEMVLNADLGTTEQRKECPVCGKAATFKLAERDYRNKKDGPAPRLIVRKW